MECICLEEVLVHSELVGGGELHGVEPVVQELDQQLRKHWARHSSLRVLELETTVGAQIRVCGVDNLWVFSYDVVFSWKLFIRGSLVSC